MKKESIFLMVSLSLLLCVGCVPKVTTKVIKNYTPLGSQEEVKVFYSTNKDTVIKGEILGEVKVSDTGFTTSCDSVSVISHIIEKARQMGGNAIYVTKHLRPSMASSCHRMIANVLLLDTSSALPKTALVKSTVEKNDSSKYITLKNNIQPVYKLYKARLALNAGYVWRTAEINPNLPEEEKKYLKELMSGIGWNASADYFFNNLYGISLNYAGYKASTSKDTLSTKDLITYIGADFLVRENFGSKVMVTLSLGFGYMNYTTETKHLSLNQKLLATGSTLGMHLAIEGEYKFSDNWGAGIKFSSLNGALSNMVFTYPDGSKETVTFPKDAGEGLANLRLVWGIRYYFN